MTNQDFFDNYQDAWENERIQFSDFVSLDFPYLQLYYWTSGNPQLLRVDNNGKALEPNNIEIFGGWYAGENKFIPQTQLLGGIPKGFYTQELHPKGDPFTAYTAPLIYVSYITHREGWFARKDSAKKISEIDILCLLGEWQIEEKIFKPYGPIVLSASSYTAGDLKQAFRDWREKSSVARMNAKQQPESRFFIPVGGFPNIDQNGKESVYTERRGTGQKSSVVTPPRLKEPKTIDYNLLKMLFVAHDRSTLDLIRDLYNRAQPWVADMKNKVTRADDQLRDEALTSAARYQQNGHVETSPPANYPDF